MAVTPIPVVCECLVVLCIQGPCSRKHDGGVQVGDDAGHSAGGCDAGLGATIPSLERGQHVGDLREESHVGTVAGAPGEDRSWVWEKGQRKGLGSTAPRPWGRAQSPSQRLSGHTL